MLGLCHVLLDRLGLAEPLQRLPSLTVLEYLALGVGVWSQRANGPGRLDKVRSAVMIALAGNDATISGHSRYGSVKFNGQSLQLRRR